MIFTDSSSNREKSIEFNKKKHDSPKKTFDEILREVTEGNLFQKLENPTSLASYVRLRLDQGSPRKEINHRTI